MRGLGIILFVGGAGLILEGITGGSLGLAAIGVLALVIWWALKSWMRKDDIRVILGTVHPGASAEVELGGMGETIAVIRGVRVGKASEAVESAWGVLRRAYPARASSLAVVVQDDGGGYWGTDSLRMNPPHAVLEPVERADPANPFVAVMLETGTMRVGEDGQCYNVVPVDPWGPLDSPAPFGFELLAD